MKKFISTEELIEENKKLCQPGLYFPAWYIVKIFKVIIIIGLIILSFKFILNGLRGMTFLQTIMEIMAGLVS